MFKILWTLISSYDVPILIFNFVSLLFLKASWVLVAVTGEINMTHIEELVPLIFTRLPPGLKVCGLNTHVGEPIKFVHRLLNNRQ